jgi:phosphonate transport system substrate-binding protein
MIRKISHRLATAVALAMLLAACGGADAADTGDDAAAETTVTTAAEATETTASADSGDTQAPETTEAAAADSDWPDKLVFAAVPSAEEGSLQESYAPILQVLSEDLGVEIEFFLASDYAGVVEGMISGNIDIAQFGPFAYVIAVGNGADIEPIGVMVDGEAAEPGYRAYGITGANSDIASLEDFAGRNVCFVDPGSTSGYLYPSAGLLAADIDPETGVAPVFAGGHDAAVLSVANGTCEAGFAFDAMITTLLPEAGDIAGVVDVVEDENVNPDNADIRIVWKSEVIAGSPLAIQSSLPADLIAEASRILIEEANVDALIERGICSSADDCQLTDEGVWGYAFRDDSFYDGVRAVCELTRAASCDGL